MSECVSFPSLSLPSFVLDSLDSSSAAAQTTKESRAALLMSLFAIELWLLALASPHPSHEGG